MTDQPPPKRHPLLTAALIVVPGVAIAGGICILTGVYVGLRRGGRPERAELTAG